MAMPTEKTDKQTFEVAVRYKSPVSGEWLETKATKKLFSPEKISTVAVNYTDNDGKSQSQDCEFEQIPGFETIESLLGLAQTNPTFVLSCARYGSDLYGRNIAKAPQGTELEGPGKMLKKQAEQLMSSRAKQGRVITFERAMEIVQAMNDME
jgi:hypothetical protein